MDMLQLLEDSPLKTYIFLPVMPIIMHTVHATFQVQILFHNNVANMPTHEAPLLRPHT